MKQESQAPAQKKYYFFLLIVMLAAYLPLSGFHFGMKNDAFSDNFPGKYFLSAALHAGHFPLWNPYMNFGFPVYADPGFAYWNPVTWIFALIGYNAYTLTLEVLVYLYISGACMFNLGRYLKFSYPVAFCVAVMYMCSGFFVGSIQYINFITAAAFLPFLLQSFLQLMEKPSVKTSAKFSIAFYCVVMGGHPAIPVATVYFLLIVFLLCCLFLRKDENFNLGKTIFHLCLGAFFLLLLSAPMIYSYANIWGDYNRNFSQQSFGIKNTGIDFGSFISLVFPFATTAHGNIFFSDVAMRNLYFSLLGLLGFFFAFGNKDKPVRIFFLSSICMLVLSVGGNFKTAVYQFLPGLNFVRTNGEFRVFSIFLFCLISGYGLTNVFNNKNAEQLFKKIIRWLLPVCLFSIVLLIMFGYRNLSDLFNKVQTPAGIANKIKTFLDNENLNVAFLVSLMIMLVLTVFFLSLKIDFRKKVIVIILLDVAINTFIYLPVTGVGTKTLPEIQAIYNANPEGIPVPPLIPVNKIDTLDKKTTGLVGDLSYYNKKIGVQQLTDYPSYFKSTDLFFKSPEKDFVLNKPYIFLKSGSKNFRVTDFSPQNITVKVESNEADSLYLLQNHYKFWKAFNDHKEIAISTAFTGFMAVPVHKGLNTIAFIYDDANLKYFFLISVLTLVALLLLALHKPDETKLN